MTITIIITSIITTLPCICNSKVMLCYKQNDKKRLANSRRKQRLAELTLVLINIVVIVVIIIIKTVIIIMIIKSADQGNKEVCIADLTLVLIVLLIFPTTARQVQTLTHLQKKRLRKKSPQNQ